MQTRPLSKCMLLACAYQRTRQRNMGIAKRNLRRLWTTIWQRGTVWKTSSQQTLRKYQPCASTRELLNNTKNVSINKTLSLTTLGHDFYPATFAEHPINNYDPDRVPFWKTCNWKKCINIYTLDLGWYAIEGHLLEHLLKPIHAIK